MGQLKIKSTEVHFLRKHLFLGTIAGLCLGPYRDPRGGVTPVHARKFLLKETTCRKILVEARFNLLEGRARIEPRHQWTAQLARTGNSQPCFIADTREAAHSAGSVVARNIVGRIEPALQCLIMLRNDLNAKQAAVLVPLQKDRHRAELRRMHCLRRSGRHRRRLVGNRFIALDTAPGESNPRQAPRVPIWCE